MSELTLFFIVEPPDYQRLSCYLAASIRRQFDEPVKLIGYCPAHRMGDLNPHAVEALERMEVEVRPMETEGRFEPAYPHGNKILACMEPRDTKFAGFVDSDVLFIRPNTVANLVAQNAVSLTPAASMYWSNQAMWKTIYGALGREIPEERIWLMRQRRRRVIPYFSSGLLIFPDRPILPRGQRFGDVWMETAQAIDTIDGLERKRPYLDQMSLPLAIQEAGLDWNLLPEEQHFILGGALRHTPFPKDRKIFTVHYRQWKVLMENGLSRVAKQMLEAEIGVRRISHLPDVI